MSAIRNLPYSTNSKKSMGYKKEIRLTSEVDDYQLRSAELSRWMSEHNIKEKEEYRLRYAELSRWMSELRSKENEEYRLRYDI